jgi:hypothetical protein
VQRSFWQHFIGKQRRGLGHAPRTTGRAEPALLAAELHQLLDVAALAARRVSNTILALPQRS